MSLLALTFSIPSGFPLLVLPARPDDVVGGGTTAHDRISEYRRVGSMTFPFRVEADIPGRAVYIQLEKITLNEPLPPEATELPEEIETLAYQAVPNEIREPEVDKDRPILRRRPAPKPP